MAMLKKVTSLTLLFVLLAFPASAFASGHSGSYKDSGILTTLLSFLGGGSNNRNADSFDKYIKTDGFNVQSKNGGFDNYGKAVHLASYSKHSSFDNYGKTNSYVPPKNSFWSWLNKKKWWHDWCWWDDGGQDSFKLWEKYYGY